MVVVSAGRDSVISDPMQAIQPGETLVRECLSITHKWLFLLKTSSKLSRWL